MAITRLGGANAISGTIPVSVGGTGVTTSAALANTGNLVLLSSQTASGDSSIAFNNTIITSSYDNYYLTGDGIISSNDLVQPRIRVSADNGSSYLNAEQGRLYIGLNNTGNGKEGDSGVAYIRIASNVGNDANRGYIFETKFFDLNNSSDWKWGNSQFTGKNDGGVNNYTWVGGFGIQSTSAVNYIDFYFSAGTISQGNFQLYGVKR